MFRKILIANRGEIAVRILRTCQAMRIAAVAVYSDVDRAALHVRLADQAVHIGAAPAAESYLDIERILDAARTAGADAIHPGYGFLSENPAFAEACSRAGITFIGPSAGAMALLGSKTAARRCMAEAGVPVLPGSPGAVRTAEEALEVSGEIGFPLMLKAAGGGGGKGMRLVGSRDELASAFEQARDEARRAFGDPSIFLEKALIAPRHIELQVLADEHGNVIHLGERECSLQRRHQKILEEAPAPLGDQLPGLREKIAAAGVRAARSAGYTNAGTVEFLVDDAGGFYFLEVNTRLQVEHPVTEMVTGIDLVREQIRVAAGETLGRAQDQVQLRGHAIECRIYAEDPANNFMPSPGKITALREPSGPGVRVDSGAYEGWEVPVEYDPLIAKLIVWGADRPEAIARMRVALDEYHVGGIRTTLPLFRELAGTAEFQAGRVDTGFLERGWTNPARPPDEAAEQAVVLAAGYHHMRESSRDPAETGALVNLWKQEGRRSLLR